MSTDEISSVVESEFLNDNDKSISQLPWSIIDVTVSTESELLFITF